MKKLIITILFFTLTSPSWAYLTAGKVAVTATSSSAGVSSTSQDSSISQNLSSGNVGIGSTSPGGSLDVPGTICFSHSCLSSWPAGGSQTSGSSILAGNGTGGFTNVTASGGASYSAGALGGNLPSFGYTANSTLSPSNGVALKITSLGTKVFDTGSYFTNSSTYTPLVAGTYLISAGEETSSESSGTLHKFMLYKNGSPIFTIERSADTNDISVGLNFSNFPVAMNGSTDFLEIYVQIGEAGDTVAGAGKTYLSGYRIN